MNPNQKTILLALLTVVFYGISIFITSGNLIFPFPLFELISLIVALRIATVERNDKILWFGAVPTLFIGAFHTQFIWSFLLPPEKLEHFFLSLKYDLIYLLYFLGIFLWGIAFIWFSNRKPSIFLLIFIALFCLLPFLHTYYIELLLFLFLTIYGIWKKQQNPSTYLFLLLTILNVFRICMVYFFP